MTNQPPLLWQGKSIDDLDRDILKKLAATLTQHVSKRAATNHNTRTKKLGINFKSTENGYLKQLLGAVEVALRNKK